jgi:hypothetical protein
MYGGIDKAKGGKEWSSIGEQKREIARCTYINYTMEQQQGKKGNSECLNGEDVAFLFCYLCESQTEQANRENQSHFFFLIFSVYLPANI